MPDERVEELAETDAIRGSKGETTEQEQIVQEKRRKKESDH